MGSRTLPTIGPPTNASRASTRQATVARKGSSGGTSFEDAARPAGSANTGGGADEGRLVEEAKSRFNIGLACMKTGDHAKARGNLERSLSCRIRLSGHDSRAYSNDTLVAIARALEKLGDCLLADGSVVDKGLASVRYEESRRFLRNVDPKGGAPDDLEEALARVEESLKRLGSRVAGAPSRETDLRRIDREDPARNSSNCVSRIFENKNANWEEAAMAHLRRGDHRQAFEYLMSLPGGGHSTAHFMMKVAASALEAEDIAVATDAFEDSLKILRNVGDAGGDDMKIAVRGCIRGHKLLAKETEAVGDYDAAISHRTRVCQLLEEDDRIVPACLQRAKIAYLRGAKGEYEDSAAVLSEAIVGLRKTSDDEVFDRGELLIQCHQMQAICYAKSRKRTDALEQYDEFLRLVARRDGRDGGRGSKRYNCALIHKSALLVAMGDHLSAASAIDEYFKNVAACGAVVDDSDHAVALDTAVHLQLDNVDWAISDFKKKLAFVKTIPDSARIKSDAMHNQQSTDRSP